MSARASLTVFKGDSLSGIMYLTEVEWVGMARCAVAVAERSVRRRKRTQCEQTLLPHPFRPALRSGRGQRSALSLPFQMRRCHIAMPTSSHAITTRGEVLQPFLRDQRQVFQVWKDEVTAWVC
jgi:hypothetical protein